ncbi:MAG: HupE/UreJ family protein, partial [Gemmatimonadota bacterium]|nr:HupE/UreJ family protein [Gemmatimonadota bacterium]
MKRIALVPALALALGSPAPADAHDVDVTSVARVFLEQVGDRRYVLSIVDLMVPRVSAEPGTLPAHCAPVTSDVSRPLVIRGLVFECEQELTFDDAITLPWPLEGIVVLATWSNGVRASAFFRGDGASIRIHLGDLRAGPGSMARLGRRYFSLGVEHILSGVDHLLFIVGLLVLVHGLWPLVKTITAFTIAHSITLGAAVLGWVPVESGPVEAAIALSIVLLAREIVVGYRGRVHLVHKKPWLV